MEDEEEVEGVFYNDMYSLELDKAKWHQVLLRLVLLYTLSSLLTTCIYRQSKFYNDINLLRNSF